MGDLTAAKTGLKDLTGAAASLTGISEIQLHEDEVERLVNALNDFLSAWFPNISDVVLDPKITSAIALVIVVAGIGAPRVMSVIAKKHLPPAQNQNDPKPSAGPVFNDPVPQHVDVSSLML